MQTISTTTSTIDPYGPLAAAMNRHMMIRGAIELGVSIVKYFLLGLASGLVIALLT